MVQTASRFQISLRHRAVMLGPIFLMVPFSSVLAQVQPIPVTEAQAPVVAVYKGPPPVVMFRAKAPPMAEPSAVPQAEPASLPEPESEVGQRPYSIINQAQIDAANPQWDPRSIGPVVAPPIVAADVAAPDFRAYHADTATPALANAASPPRRALRRILQDTGRGLVYDVPEAIANSLPWVDRDAKNEPFDQVLDRVASELARANASDPAWALPAQREIRALSRRLEFLPAPPPELAAESTVSEQMARDLQDRPFRPRPIWPGANGRPEPQVRPVTLTTTTVQENGPNVSGIRTRYIPAAEDDDGNPVVASPSTVPRRPGAGRPARAAAKPKAR